jgi:hypothetical protein
VSDALPEVPSQAELDAHSIPAIIRRAPRFARIIGTGAGVGFVFGVLIALGLPGRGASYRAVVALLVGLGLAMVGALSAGAIATRSDGPDRRARSEAWKPLGMPEVRGVPDAPDVPQSPSDAGANAPQNKDG